MPISRRDLARQFSMAAVAAGVPSLVSGQASPAMSPPAGSLTDVQGIRVGHVTHAERPTGCTVILFDDPS